MYTVKKRDEGFAVVSFDGQHIGAYYLSYGDGQSCISDVLLRFDVALHAFVYAEQYFLDVVCCDFAEEVERRVERRCQRVAVFIYYGANVVQFVCFA